MAGFRERDKHWFPLKCVKDVVDLFKGQLENNDEPDLTLLSIVIGAVECCLTVNRTVVKADHEDRNCAANFPAIHLHTIEALYERFVVHVKGSVDLSQYGGKYATRELVKKVSDVIWNSLARSYHKDKAHLQSIYSFLTGSKLDCFGVALATVAACQQLDYNDVHLALSEDHAWVVYGEQRDDTVEVTWHGKGLEDRRGLPISQGLEEKSWLYLNGHPVVCTRHMEVAALVSGINPAINSTMDSVEMAGLQQTLLWYLYDKGHLERYPLALGNLGELEDVSATDHEISPKEFFTKAVRVAQSYYNNSHVYPYTYLGSYHYRKGHYRQALENWAQAAAVIGQYNHNREDEEIYKEFLEIANDHIPNIVKGSGDELHRAHLIPPKHTPLLQDPRCYSLLLQFYDGICQWEEGSKTPVLHALWAQHLVHSLGKFDEEARVNIVVEKHADEENENTDEESDGEMHSKWKLRRDSISERPLGYDKSQTGGVIDKESLLSPDLQVKRGRGRPPKRLGIARNNNNNKENGFSEGTSPSKLNGNGLCILDADSINPKTLGEEEPDLDLIHEDDSQEEQIKNTIQELVSRVGDEVPGDAPNPSLAALAHACGESILNPEFLLAGGEPFAMSSKDTEELFSDAELTVEGTVCSKSNPLLLGNEIYMETESGSHGNLPSHHHNDSEPEHQGDTSDEAQIVPDHGDHGDHGNDAPTQSDVMVKSLTVAPSDSQDTHCTDTLSVNLDLHSAKMRGLKGLLVAKKLNHNAIKLQVTAQSQVHLKHSVSGTYSVGTRKRLRRE